ncbi:MAG TPA: response regulator [Rectinemataceae bacterium]
MKGTSKRVRTFSALEAAELCGVVNQTAINWIRSGHLKAFSTPGGQYRIYEDDLVAFLKDRGMRIPPELEAESPAEIDRNLVLVVDDDRDLNQVLKRILERRLKNIGVIQAFDGFEAGKLVAERHPALIFLDYDLPGLDGASLCARIRGDASLGNPSVVSMTGLDTPDVRDKLISAGADAFFPKPLDFAELCAKAEELLAARDPERGADE